ncbi:hypothetical protein SBRCBS47491_004604 [Sporothrix bragantina]|uniref:Uncharacterized protein n=1 Tax=Sporothrix bragantina TaxID=671064 RepID=A0ABP0BRH6_9PEZI
MDKDSNDQASHKVRVVDDFTLSRPHKLKLFYRCIRKVFDGGIGPRRAAIDKALNTIEADKNRVQKKGQ